MKRTNGKESTKRTTEKLNVCVKQWLKQPDHYMPPTIDFLLRVPIFTWKCSNTLITPHTNATHRARPPRQLLLRLPSGEKLTTAYQPLAHHTAGTVAQKRGRGGRGGSGEKERR